VPEPVFRFADEYHEVPDATLWVWTREGRPLAFQKIEANAWAGNSDWSIIFATVAQQPLCVEWQGGKTFHHNGTGAIFRPFPDGDPPAEGSRRREMQLRELKGRFRGRISPRGDADNAALRILPTPIYRYSERDTKRPLGAVYGVTVTGTNPNLLLVIEARPDERAVERWHYAFARMSGTSGEIRLDDEIVWKFAAETSGSLEDRAWTSFFLPRTLPLPQRQDN
jgi:hypothetical protein